VTLECPRGSKLAQLVSYHILGDRDLHMLATVMNHECDIHELGNNRAGTGPRLDRLAAPRLRLFLHFEKQFRIDEWAFLATSAHEISIDSYGFLWQSDRQVIIGYLCSFNCPYRLLLRRRTIELLLGLRFWRVAPPLALLPVGLTG
jgi:hypothetical protein